MVRRASLAAALLAIAGAIASPAWASRLYAATAHDDPATHASAGYLYTVDPGSGKARQIGPILVDGTSPVAVDGLAMHPKTGVLYGITSGSSRPPTFITIDTRNAQAHVIGPLGAHATDIHFAANGSLYTWLPEVGRLGVIDIATGEVRAFAPTGVGPTATAGFAINSQGVAVVAARMSKGILDEVDTTTGTVIGGLALIDASVLTAINALTLSPGGALLAVNTVKGGSTKRELVSIDVETGNITRIGSLPDEVDALAFDQRPQAPRGSKRHLLIIMLLLLLGLGIAGRLRWRNTK